MANKCPFHHKKAKQKFIVISTLSKETQTEIQKHQSKFHDHLNLLKSKVKNPVEGFFGPESMHWKIYSKPGLFFGSLRALFLQIAHPAVAEGVYQFSNFKHDTFGRATRTFNSMFNLFFGDVDQAIKTAKKLNRIHYSIRGTYAKTANSQRAIPFCANNEDLLLWVYATIFDTTLKIHQKVHGVLTIEEQNKFYEESKTTATLLGIPSDIYPSSLESFNTYFHHMLSSENLWLGASGKDVSKALIYSPYSISFISKIMISAMIPDHLCEGFEVDYGKHVRRRFERMVNFGKFIIKIIPNGLLSAPPYHQARFRIARSRGIKLNFMERSFDSLVTKKWFPFSI